ncbi:MAG TPA: hypoxanthine phosphoribosyltransferase [Longimicrobium sp.]|jgi:hypoxanthine phosphoribosyltransferase|uniref:hypoxanthine phosphoribosyltransferase n=1 Tax=Longimicrobium sp. TaxID=2029185 RepID=UPI002ED80F5B
MPTTPETLARTGGQPLSHVLFSEEQIAERVRQLGEQITRDIPEGEDLLVLGLLKGSFIFLSDLVRQIRRPMEVDFLIVSSYGAGTESSGDVKLLYAREASVTGKHVVLVEDIVDSGTTLNRLLPILEASQPKSLEICALLHKHIAQGLVKEPRWVGFDCPQEFVIGYGLDHSEKYRNLPFVGVIDP